MKNMKYLGGFFIIIFFLVFFAFSPKIRKAFSEISKSRCFKCHTSAKQLIKITREIAKTRPVVESENEGEG